MQHKPKHLFIYCTVIRHVTAKTASRYRDPPPPPKKKESQDGLPAIGVLATKLKEGATTFREGVLPHSDELQRWWHYFSFNPRACKFESKILPTLRTHTEQILLEVRRAQKLIWTLCGNGKHRFKCQQTVSCRPSNSVCAFNGIQTARSRTEQPTFTRHLLILDTCLYYYCSKIYFCVNVLQKYQDFYVC
jgi:hypothetical protein